MLLKNTAETSVYHPGQGIWEIVSTINCVEWQNGNAVFAIQPFFHFQSFGTNCNVSRSLGISRESCILIYNQCLLIFVGSDGDISPH